MKLILIILSFITAINCNHQTREMDNSKETYNYWQESSIKTIISNENLLDYQKENLIRTINNVTLNSFLKLNRILPSDKRNKDTEYYLLEFSEGEVVTAKLYYVIKSNQEYQLAYLNIYEENKNSSISKKSNSDIKKLISLKPINDNSLNDELFVLVTINKEDKFAIIGNKE